MFYECHCLSAPFGHLQFLSTPILCHELLSHVLQLTDLCRRSSPMQAPQVFAFDKKLWSCWETYRSSASWRSERARVPIPDVLRTLGGFYLVGPPIASSARRRVQVNSIQLNLWVYLVESPLSLSREDIKGVCILFSALGIVYCLLRSSTRIVIAIDHLNAHKLFALRPLVLTDLNTIGSQ